MSDLGARSDGQLRNLLAQDAQKRLGQRIRPSTIDSLWALEPARRDAAAELAAAEAQGRLPAWLAALDPPGEAYAALAAERRRYEAMAARGGWSTLPAGRVIRPGDPPSAAVEALRERLSSEGYEWPDPVDPKAYDPALQSAVQTFQQRHDLDADGVVGTATRRALDAPVAFRLMQIEANMERLRWLPRDLPSQRVEVDTGRAELRLYQQGRPSLSMRVVVGDPRHQTPMFASALEAVVFNPPWNVPTSIATKEIWPKAARDPGYLARNNFVRTPNGLQQRPGPSSALGVLKFDLDSPFGVYLHDTPSRSAFARRVRTLSHGCMRLEAPRPLAAKLLAPEGWTEADIDAAIAAGATRRVQLQTPTPLFVVHRTVVTDAMGRAVFSPDVYGWDAKLAQALGRAAPHAQAALQRSSECSGRSRS